MNISCTTSAHSIAAIWLYRYKMFSGIRCLANLNSIFTISPKRNGQIYVCLPFFYILFLPVRGASVCFTFFLFPFPYRRYRHIQLYKLFADGSRLCVFASMLHTASVVFSIPQTAQTCKYHCLPACLPFAVTESNRHDSKIIIIKKKKQNVRKFRTRRIE